MIAAQETITQFVKDQVEEMVKHARVKYNSPDFNVHIKLSFAGGVHTSRGGLKYSSGPFIKLACHRYIAPCENPEILIDENEYSHYRTDPVIGEMKNVHWTQALALLVAHEVAHAIQFHYGTKEAAAEQFGIKNLDRRNVIFLKHDWFYQRIYADLRSNFVNGRTFTTPVIAPKRKNNRAWTSVVSNKYGGQFVHYYQLDGTLIGILFYRANGNVKVYHRETATYEDTGTTKYSEARKKYFNI